MDLTHEAARVRLDRQTVTQLRVIQVARVDPGRLQVRLLGPLDLLIDGEAVALGRRKQRLLLALLAVNPGRVVSLSSIIANLWRDSPPARVRNQVQNHVSALRGIPSDHGLARDTLSTHGEGYCLALPPGATDLEQVDALSQMGEVAIADGALATAESMR